MISLVLFMIVLLSQAIATRLNVLVVLKPHDCPTARIDSFCATLDEIGSISKVRSYKDIHLTFLEGEHLLSQELMFRHLEAVSFKKLHGSITIKCRNSSFIHFAAVHYVQIEDISLTGCGSRGDPLPLNDLYNHYNAALHFYDVHIIKLSGLHLSECQYSIHVSVHHNSYIDFHIIGGIFEKSQTSLSFYFKGRNEKENEMKIRVTDCIFRDTLLNYNNLDIYPLSAGCVHLHSHEMIVKEVIVTNCSFTNISNMAFAVRESQIKNMEITNCTFQKNDISHFPVLFILCASYRCSNFHGRAHISNSIFTDNYRSNTSGSNNAVIHMFFGSVLECKNIYVSNNSLTGLVLIGTNVLFIGMRNYFINNRSPNLAGGLYITGLNYYAIDSTSKVFFINNTAQHSGGGIYVSKELSFYSKNDFNRCTFQTLEDFPGRLTFSGNRAVMAGDAVYGGRYFDCKMWGQKAESKGFPRLTISRCPVIDRYWNLSGQNNASASTVATSPIKVCSCNNSSIDYTLTKLTVFAYPGVQFAIRLLSVGNCGGVSSGTIITTAKNGTLSTVSNDQYTELHCKEFHFSTQPVNGSNSTTLYIETASTASLKLTVVVNYLPCPLGFEYYENERLCKCHKNITKYYQGIKCSLNSTHIGSNHTNYSSEFFIPGNFWLGYIVKKSCIIAHSTCPFDYCHPNPLVLNNIISRTDSQCQYNRSGLLCGQCQKGLSVMLGSNKCGECNSNSSIALVAVFLLAGLILVSFLIVANMTISVGTVNGLLFYANVVKLNETVFFSKGKVLVLSQFISWLNLDWGIETCFINGLDGYWKTWLQFVFPLYIWLIVVCIIIGCRYSTRLCRICGKNIVPVLATLFVMSFTKLLLTVTKSLSVTLIDCGGNYWRAWSVDSKIVYLDGKHIPLFVASICALIVGLVFTLVVLFSPWLQRYSSKFFRKSSRDPIVKLKPLIDAYTGPYKDIHRYWTGLLLSIRLFLTPLFSYTTGTVSYINNYVLIFVMIILLIGISKFPYRRRPLNYLEALHYINLLALALTSSCLRDSSLNLPFNIEAVLSIVVSMIAFFIVFLGHLLFKVNLLKPSLCITRERHQRVMEASMSDMSSITLLRRESLLFDDNI